MVRAVALLIIATILLSNTPYQQVKAEFDCKDTLILFARGSGQNKNSDFINQPLSKDFERAESQSFQFFNEINSRIQNSSKEFVSLHNFEGRYNGYGYKAVSVSDGFSKKATHRKDVGNLYYESVKDGAEELAWYLEDKLTSCPLQQVVLGGYSQGAQVVGEALQILPAQFRARIAYTALFGDPKFNSRLNGSPTTKTGYWVRGSANGLQTGSLGARAEYVPAGLNNVTSWCDKADPVCSARYALQNPVNRFVVDYFLNHVHSTVYQEQWIPQSANEIANILKGRLGSDATKNQVWLNKNDKSYKMDLALVIDGSGSMISQVANIKAKVGSMVTALYGAHWDTRVAIVAYNDLFSNPGSPTEYVTKVVQPFTTDRALITTALNNFKTDTYPHDIPEAMYSGLMTAFNDLSWRYGAQKKTIVITDAPAKNPDPRGWTKQQVVKRALELDPVSISFVSLPLNQPSYQSELNRNTDYLAGQTNGIVQKGSYSYEVKDITTLLDKTMLQPTALLEGDISGFVNEPMYITGGSSYDPDGSIKEYAWDCKNDGVFETVTTSPNYECTYSEPYAGYIVMEARTEDGGSAKAILWVDVINGASPAVQIPQAPALTAQRTSESSATLTNTTLYPDGSTTLVELDAEQNILNYFLVNDSIPLNDIATSEITIIIAAKNEAGVSEPAVVTIPAYVPPPPPEPTLPDKILPETEPNPVWIIDKYTSRTTPAPAGQATTNNPAPNITSAATQNNTGNINPSPEITAVAGTTDNAKTPPAILAEKATATPAAVAKPDNTIIIVAFILLAAVALATIWRKKPN